MSEGAAPAGLRWWFPSVPAERLAVLRILVGSYSVVYLAIRLPYLLSFARHRSRQFEPIGLLAWMDEPFVPTLYRTLVAVTFLASLLFLAGRSYRVAAPVFGGLLLVVLTYVNSFGGILHSDNLWVLHVLVLALSPAADALSLDARRAGEVSKTHFKYGWAIQLMCWVCVFSYFLAGLAKLKNSGIGFIEGESLRNYVALDNVRKIELGSLHSPLASFLLPFPWVFQGLAAISLLLELAAPLVMFGARVAKAWSVAMWGFHLGVLGLMAILFPYPVTFIAFAPFFRTERLAPRIRRFAARAREPGKRGVGSS